MVSPAVAFPLKECSSDAVRQPEWLLADCLAIAEKVNALSDNQYRQRVDGKWSVADVLQHLYRSARPVLGLMTGSRDALLPFGPPANPGQTYELIQHNYYTALAGGLRAPDAFAPRNDDALESRQERVSRLLATYQALANAVANWTDTDLDTLAIPHPALGLLSMRQMLYFTQLHTRHHRERL